MTQAERDRLEEERIAQAKARREALLSGRAAQNDVRRFLSLLRRCFFSCISRYS